MASGAMFAPKFVENKSKFFPDTYEPWFGNTRDRCVSPSQHRPDGRASPSATTSLSLIRTGPAPQRAGHDHRFM
jgi:hypothetical protein